MRKFITIILTLISAVSMSAASSHKEKEADGTEKNYEIQDFDRGITMSNSIFIPKGTFGTGLTFSYNTIDLGKSEGDAGYSLLSLMTGVTGEMYSFGIAPNVTYFLLDNLAVGLRFNYDRASLDLGNANLAFGEMLSLSISDYHYLSHTYKGSLTCRYYMPFGSSKRFAMFAEGRLTGGYGQSVLYRMDNEDKFGTYQNTLNCSIDVVPGLTAFVTNNVALEVSIGVLGLNYKRTEQVTNQVYTSVMESSGANFKLDLFSVGMGVSVYLPTKLYLIKK